MSSKAREQELAMAQDFAAVFSGPQGERVLYHIIERICGVHAATLIPRGTGCDPILSGALIGRRDVGTEIRRLVHLKYTAEQKPEVKKRKDNAS